MSKKVLQEKQNLNHKPQPSPSGSTGFEPLDWLQSHPMARAQARVGNTPEVQQFLSSFWPFSTEFYNPINPIFSMQVLDLNILNQDKKWFLRDGLIGVMWFFKTYPQPRGQYTLYIDKRWRSIVPKAWYPNVEYWEPVTTASSKEIKHLIFYGLAVSTAYVKEEAQRKIQNVKSALGSRFDEINKLGFFPARFHHSAGEHVFHFSFYQKLMQELGGAINPVDFNDLNSIGNAKGYHITKLVTDYLVGDDYLTNLMLSRGASVEGIREVATISEIELRTSNYHGYVFSKEHMESTEELQTELVEALSSPCYTDIDWPRYYGKWSK